MKLTPKRRAALEFLASGPWTAAWWGAMPHAGWPKEMNGRTFDDLFSAKLVTIVQGERFDKTVKITEAGRQALLA